MITITLGNRTDLSITEDNHLIMTQKTENGGVSGQIDLGLATMNRFAILQQYLQRLQVHAIEEKII